MGFRSDNWGGPEILNAFGDDKQFAKERRSAPEASINAEGGVLVASKISPDDKRRQKSSMAGSGGKRLPLPGSLVTIRDLIATLPVPYYPVQLIFRRVCMALSCAPLRYRFAR